MSTMEQGDFPDEDGRTDLVVPVCTAWLEAICSLKIKGPSSRKVWFMDGPYRVDLDAAQDGHIRLRFIEERYGLESGLKDVVVDADNALRDLWQADGQVLHECRSS